MLSFEEFLAERIDLNFKGRGGVIIAGDPDIAKIKPTYVDKKGLVQGLRDMGFKEPQMRFIGLLYSYKNVKAHESIVGNALTEDLMLYREYARDPSSGFTGSNTDEEYEEIKADIKKNGIKNPIIVTFKRLRQGEVEIFISEGNHRVRAAYELGIKQVKTRFYYID